MKLLKLIKQKLCSHEYELVHQFTINDPDDEKVTHIKYICSKCGKEYKIVY